MNGDAGARARLTRLPHVLLSRDRQGRRTVRVERRPRVAPIAELRPFTYAEAPSLRAGFSERPAAPLR